MVILLTHLVTIYNKKIHFKATPITRIKTSVNATKGNKCKAWIKTGQISNHSETTGKTKKRRLSLDSTYCRDDAFHECERCRMERRDCRERLHF